MFKFKFKFILFPLIHMHNYGRLVFKKKKEIREHHFIVHNIATSKVAAA